jgi:rubrerythrin
MFSIEEVLELAIRLEKNGEHYYRHFLDLAQDPEIKKIFSWLADQEVQHANFFNNLKQMHTERPSDFPETHDGMLLQDYLGDRALSLDEVDLASLTDPHRVLQAALEFENDTIVFFDMIKVFVTEESALAQLEAIILEERRHIEILQNLIIQEPSAKIH